MGGGRGVLPLYDRTSDEVDLGEIIKDRHSTQTALVPVSSPILNGEVTCEVHPIVEDPPDLDFAVVSCPVQEEMPGPLHPPDGFLDTVATIAEMVGPCRGSNLRAVVATQTLGGLLPRQVSSACCCILTRRASEGSASEPALARRKLCEI